MERSHLTRAAKYLADLRRRTAWRKIVSFLSVMVVFCTVYALVLPAITMTRPTICGQEEHRHDAACFAAAAEPAPIDAAVALPRQVCGLESVYPGLLPEERAGFIIHVHDESCYQDGMLICTLPEVPPHVHEEKCYVQERILICGQEEEVCIPDNPVPTEHFHTEACYAGVLACGQEQSDEAGGHVHTPDCYQQELACGQEETGPEDEAGPEEGGSPEDVTGPEEGTVPEDETGPEEVPGPEEGTAPEDETGPEEGDGPEDETGPEEGTDPEGEAGPEEGTLPEDETLPEEGTGHVHTDECYILGEYVAACGDRRIVHEHGADCLNEFGELICGWPVTREHVHGPECFLEAAPEEPGQEEPQPEEPICGMTEHTHGEECYAPEEPEVPDQNQDQWDAIFWSGVVESYGGDAVLDARVSGVWSDTSAMDPAYLEELRGAAEADLTRYLDRNVGIQVDGRLYSEAMGPMDAGAEFGILLQWSMSGAGFGTMTYTYQFPWQVLVEDVAKQVLNDDNGEQALTYSIQDNMLSITYYKPVESVSASFSLRASWAEDLGESTQVQWSNSAYSDVLFALPELTVEKVMGEDGLRVEEDGSVWADYAVTVANTGMVQAQGVVLTDTLEAERFHFVQGGLEDGGDYVLDTGDGERSLSFDGYDGGDILQFPAFDLAPGESRVYRYMARMTAEDREAVDAAVKAGQMSGETVRNTAVAVCPASGGELEFSASARATYGGPESKHVESFSHVYEAEAFQVTFTVNGDAQLPVGMTAEKLEQTTGQGFEMTVQPLDETAGEYQAFAALTETDEEAALLDMQVLKVGMRYNGVTLNLEDCDITAAVTPTDALRNYQEPHTVNYTVEEPEEPLGDEGFGVVLKAYSLGEEGSESPAIESAPAVLAPVEKGSIYLDMGEDPDMGESAVPETPIMFEVQDGIAAFSAGIEEYPTYSVEFYGNVKLLDVIPGTDTSKNPSEDFSIIDTRKIHGTPSNGQIKNNSRESIAFLELEDDGTVRSEPVEKQLFEGKEIKFNPQKDLNLGMFLILEQFAQSGNADLNTNGETNYTLKTAVITGPNEKEEDATEENGRKIVLGERSPSDVHLTTDPEKAKNDPNTYFMAEGSTLKLICDPTSSTDYSASVVFYDYDITDGYIYKSADQNGQKYSISEQENTHTAWYAYTHMQGINSYAYEPNSARFAFGNSNTKNGLGDEKLGSFYINQGNKENFRKCSFGIATGLSNGMLQYNSKISVPNLFNESDTAAGKTTYQEGYELVFDREGDTYTLSGVTCNGSPIASASNLDKLAKTGHAWYPSNDPQSYGGFSLFSNNFWPMDGVASHGTDGHDFKFGDNSKTSERNVFGSDHASVTAPNADHGEAGAAADHNAYFGMQFKMEFTVPEGYVGPLEYCFHGDDDLWLFLDETLVCDIGGVHQSAGQYVDLRDYLPVDGPNTVGTHTLTLFYTERGASGSTCWMQFTLPGLRSVPVDVIPGDGKGNLRIEKKVEGSTDTTTPFAFNLKLDGAGTVDYTCEIYDSSNKLIETKTIAGNGSLEFSLKANEYLSVKGLPEGATYTIKETGDDRNSYETTMTLSENGGPPMPVTLGTDKRTVRGSVKSGGNASILVTYTNTFYYALPETGGPGEAGGLWYAMAALPTIAAAGLLYKRSRKKGGTPF